MYHFGPRKLTQKNEKMATITLNKNHTCSCGACIEIPKLFLEEKPVFDLKEHHTCDCEACITNISAIVDTKSIKELREDHTCECDPCTVDQRNLASM